MIAHLQEHVMKGHEVPTRAFRGLGLDQKTGKTQGERFKGWFRNREGSGA